MLWALTGTLSTESEKLATAKRRKYMNKENLYVTAEERAAQYQKWGLQRLLSGLTPEERPEIMASLFLQVSRYNADEVALDYFKIIGQCYLDIEMFPFLESQEGVLILNCPRDQFQSNINEANSAIARKVIELYPQIAGFKINEFGKYIKDDETWGSPKEVKLLETKMAMLQHVASVWRNTEDDTEADRCFLFLWAAFCCVYFGKERKICEDEMKEAMREVFPVHRLVRHRLLLAEPNLVFAQFDDNRKALEKILMHAWVNNIDSKYATKIFQIIRPISEMHWKICEAYGDAVYSLCEKSSREVVDFVAAIEELINILQPEEQIKEKIPDGIQWVPLKIGQVRMSAKVVSDKYTEIDGEMWYKFARERINEWHIRHQQYSVSFNLVIQLNYMSNTIFDKEARFIARTF